MNRWRTGEFAVLAWLALAALVTSAVAASPAHMAAEPKLALELTLVALSPVVFVGGMLATNRREEMLRTTMLAFARAAREAAGASEMAGEGDGGGRGGSVGDVSLRSVHTGAAIMSEVRKSHEQARPLNRRAVGAVLQRILTQFPDSGKAVLLQARLRFFLGDFYGDDSLTSKDAGSSPELGMPEHPSIHQKLVLAELHQRHAGSEGKRGLSLAADLLYTVHLMELKVAPQLIRYETFSRRRSSVRVHQP